MKMITNHSACDLADYIASYTDNHNIICSGLDLQIVLCYCQANALVNYNTILFSEPIIPTSFGVIIESVWNEYKFCMGTNIFPMQQPKYLDQTTRLIIDQMINTCAKYSGIELRKLVINQRPWEEAYYHNCAIDLKQLKTYFEN